MKHLDTKGEGFFLGGLRGNVSVSPLKSCIYALLMKCDGEQSRVCLHGGGSVCVEATTYSVHT